MKFNLYKNQKGLSIVEVLVATGIMAILMAGFSSMMLNQNKETRAVAEVLSAQDLMKSVIGSLAKGDVCHYILSTKTFNASQVVAGNPQEIDIGNQPIYSSMASSGTPGVALIKKGDKASVYTSSLEVESIKFEVTSGTITGTNGNFQGRWIISFDSSKTVRKLKPISVTAVISADTTNPAVANTVACLGSGGANLGKGTANHITKWSTDNEIMESIIYEEPISNRIGIGTSSPTSTLDVRGDIKIGNSVAACSSSTEGQLRYNSALKIMEFCNGIAWTSTAGSGGGNTRTVSCSYISSRGPGCGQPAVQSRCTPACPTGYSSASSFESSQYVTNMSAGICSPASYNVTTVTTVCNAN